MRKFDNLEIWKFDKFDKIDKLNKIDFNYFDK